MYDMRQARHKRLALILYEEPVEAIKEASSATSGA
jgi:hypothetical protein